MEPIRFDEAYEEILYAYNKILTEATEQGGLLEGVKSIIRGDRSRPTPKAPAIWIFPQTSVQNQTMSIKEDWDLPIQLIAIVKNTDPVLGYYESFKLASKARSVILQNRKLGLKFVSDTISKSFSPTDAPNNRKNLYAHYSLLNTRFYVLE